jgi:selenocysteine lyase/cysteine desulfurase
MERVRDLPGIQFFTNPQPQWSCAIGNFGLQGQKASDINQQLFDKWKIHSVSIDREKISGVRITPNVYTTTDELDKLVRAIQSIATSRKG